jgi:hypothetical protein
VISLINRCIVWVALIAAVSAISLWSDIVLHYGDAADSYHGWS